MRVTRRWVFSVAVVLAICAVPAFAACRDDGDGNATFEREGFPFTFEYPDSFELREDVTVVETLGGESDESDDRVAVASDDDNMIVVERFTLNVEVDETNLDQAKQEFDQLFQQVDPSAESQPGEIAGLPSLSLDAITVPTPAGESLITVLFEGDQEYLINCQSTPEGRPEVEAACDLILETLTATAERDTTTSTATTSESPSTTETAVGLIPNELRIGDCFNDSAHGTNEVGEITVVDCGSAHDVEVFALATLPGEPGFAPYPGDDEVDRLSNELCLDELPSYVGIDFMDSAWEFGYFMPTEESWRKYDDRLVVCTLNDAQFNKTEGSKRGSRT
jgi:Septum formation